MLKAMKVLWLILPIIHGFAWGAAVPHNAPSAKVRLEQGIGYRTGDVITVRVKVEGLPKCSVLNFIFVPEKGAKLDKFFEFAGWNITGDDIVLKLQIFRLADTVSRVPLPLPKLQYGCDGKTFKVALPKTTILFGPISAKDILEILPSMAPPMIDSARENGPFAMMILGGVVAVFSLFILIFNAVERRKSPQVHPYVVALRKLKKLKKQPKEAWVDGCFKIFHEALDSRFGKVMFSGDPDVKYLTETGKGLFRLSDRRMYHDEKTEFSPDAVMAATKTFFTEMKWSEL